MMMFFAGMCVGATLTALGLAGFACWLDREFDKDDNWTDKGF